MMMLMMNEIKCRAYPQRKQPDVLTKHIYYTSITYVFPRKGTLRFV